LTSYTVNIVEGNNGYISTGYVSSGYLVAQTSASDTLGRTLAATRTASQTLTITEAVKLGIARFCTGATTITESMTRRIVAVREIAQGSGGYLSNGYTSSGYLTDNEMVVTDSLGRVRNVPRSISDGQVTLSDILARKYGAVRTIARTLTVTETLGRTYDALRTITPSVTLSDTLGRTLAALRTITTQATTITELLVAFKGVAGVGTRRLFTASARLFTRVGSTSIFKRSGNAKT
jgi:hypothetical protein